MYDPNMPTNFGYRDGEQPADAGPQSDESADDALRTAREILQQSLYMKLSGRPNSSHLVDTQIVERITSALRAARSNSAPAENARVEGEQEIQKLHQAIGWICDAADAAYIEDSDNTRIHEIFNIAAQAAGLTRRLPDEHGRFDETIID